MVRMVFADNQPSRLQVVTYRFKDGMLTRRESAATRDLAELDALWLAAAKDSDTDQAVVLQSGVSGLSMRLWVNGAWRAGAADALPQTVPASVNADTVVPAGLEVTTQLQGREGNLLKIFLLGAM